MSNKKFEWLGSDLSDIKINEKLTEQSTIKNDLPINLPGEIKSAHRYISQNWLQVADPCD